MSTATNIVSSSYLILHSEHGGDFGRPWLVIRCFRDSDRQDALFDGCRKEAEAYLAAHWDDDLPPLASRPVGFGDFDGAVEPMRAIRDLISACEAVFGADCGEEEILSRARDGFTALRKLFGDERPGEEIAEAAMIEPDARVIAAVPKMLAAITKTRCNLAGLSRSGDDVFAAMVRRLDAAIALAAPLPSSQPAQAE